MAATPTVWERTWTINQAWGDLSSQLLGLTGAPWKLALKGTLNSGGLIVTVDPLLTLLPPVPAWLSLRLYQVGEQPLRWSQPNRLPADWATQAQTYVDRIGAHLDASHSRTDPAVLRLEGQLGLLTLRLFMVPDAIDVGAGRGREILLLTIDDPGSDDGTGQGIPP
jgi:hypothetical protein